MSQNYPMHARKAEKSRLVFCSSARVGSIGIAVFLCPSQSKASLGTRLRTTLKRGALFFSQKRNVARFTRVHRVVHSLRKSVTTCISEDARTKGGTFNRSALAKHDRMFFSLHCHQKG